MKNKLGLTALLFSLLGLSVILFGQYFDQYLHFSLLTNYLLFGSIFAFDIVGALLAKSALFSKNENKINPILALLIIVTPFILVFYSFLFLWKMGL